MHANFLLTLLPLFLSIASVVTADANPDNLGFAKVARRGEEAPAGSRADCANGKGGRRHRGGRHRHHHHHHKQQTGSNAAPVADSGNDNEQSNDGTFDPAKADVQQKAAVGKTITYTLTRGRGARTSTSSSANSKATSVAAPTPTPETSSRPAPAAAAAPTSSSTPAAAPVAAAAPASGSGPSDAWSKEILDAHNAARSRRGAGNLVWAQDLVDAAKAWGDACVWEHGGNSGIAGGAGQNLAAGGSSQATASQSGQKVVDMWMSEEKDYNPSSPTYSHFTQVVWKASTELGCYQSTCSGQSFKDGSGRLVFGSMKSASYTVCNYRKAGNVIGQFAANVQKA